MKTACLFSALIILFACSSGEDRIDIEKEKAAILALVEEESMAYYALEMDRWADTYLQDSTNVNISSSRYVYNYLSGWNQIYSNAKYWFLPESQEYDEVKTPLMIKVYDQSAWIVFTNQSEGSESLVTCLLERIDNKWKIVYRAVVDISSYLQGDIFIINSLNYIKNMGQSVESFAAFTGDQFKMRWNPETSLDDFVFNIRNFWGSLVNKENMEFLERDENHAVIQFTDVLLDLKNNGPRFNVTYDDYLTFMEVLYERIADQIGMTYTQETTPNGVRITVARI